MNALKKIDSVLAVKGEASNRWYVRLLFGNTSWLRSTDHVMVC